MARRKTPCPAEAVHGCTWCEKAGGGFNIRCRSCVVRWISRMPKDERLFYIDRIKDDHGAAAGEALHEEVRAARAAELVVRSRGAPSPETVPRTPDASFARRLPSPASHEASNR